MNSTNLAAHSWELQSILNTARDLLATGTTTASTGQRIAAALSINRPDLLPASYDDLIDAWEYLDPHWQQLVRIAQRHYIQSNLDRQEEKTPS